MTGAAGGASFETYFDDVWSWDGTAWMPRHKETIKEEFRQGEEIKVLLCTESASEGLNLQTCGVIVNYERIG